MTFLGRTMNVLLISCALPAAAKRIIARCSEAGRGFLDDFAGFFTENMRICTGLYGGFHK